jgi:cyclopropane fatty-acyl-phospholipid synthase-like methyltransferase
MSARNPGIGAAMVREWSQTMAPNSSILDLGCGHGVPIAQVLTEEGFTVYGVDASPKLIAAFRGRFPNLHVECSSVEASEFFRRRFDGVVAVGLMFLLRPEIQKIVIGKVAKTLSPGGRFLFTSPREAVSWSDALTGRESTSLGVERYERLLRAEGLILVGEKSDEGENHYYSVSKP